MLKITLLAFVIALTRIKKLYQTMQKRFSQKYVQYRYIQHLYTVLTNLYANEQKLKEIIK